MHCVGIICLYGNTYGTWYKREAIKCYCVRYMENVRIPVTWYIDVFVFLVLVQGTITHYSHCIHRTIYNVMRFRCFYFLGKVFKFFFWYWNYIFGAQYDALSVFIVWQTIKKHSPLLISKTHISNNGFFNTRNKNWNL